VPLKVSIFAWRLLNKRLQTKDKLAQHGVLHQRSLLCSGGYGKEGPVNHVFVVCDYFGNV